MPPRPSLALNVHFIHSGTYSSAWRTPEAKPTDFYDIDFYIRGARTAERGTFDSFFLADVPALIDRPQYRPSYALEPTIALAAIAAATQHIGLIATLSTSYNEPYNVARRIASLDHISRGRAGWNIVTTSKAEASSNFGLSEVAAHADRYDKAREFTQIVAALWDSWEPGALVGDKETARFVDLSRVHPIDHKGKHFSVRGPLNLPRSPQGWPLLVQAGGSPDGIDLAARFADVVYSVSHTLEDAAVYARKVRERLLHYGRQPDDVVICPGLVTIIGSTEEEARRRERDLWELVPLEYGLGRVADQLGIDPSKLDLDAPLPDGLKLPVNGNQTFFNVATQTAQRGRLTVRDLIRVQGGGTLSPIAIGTPEQIAGRMEEWFRAGVIGGFNIMPDVLPSGLEDFVDTVVPLLRDKGIFRREYGEGTVRERLGLSHSAHRAIDPVAPIAASVG
ncbi:LLM class flavin-dependent oxidoreductase [Bosea sp. RAF48]|uniref:LLM class flavin-dependent oxidoreductase n=1 Tax=Bosea sp. RAF48 TaxID=3237480 RepID=UPI003F930AFA